MGHGLLFQVRGPTN